MNTLALLSFLLCATVVQAVTVNGGSPTNSPVSGASSVTITGATFGATDGSATSTLGGIRCSTSMWISSTAAVCQSPVSTKTTAATGQAVGYGGAASGLSFSFDSPSVTSANPANMPTTVGMIVTVGGSGFATTDWTPTARVGGLVCGSTQWLTGSSVKCTLNAGIGGTLSVDVIAATKGGTKTAAFNFDTPVVTLNTAAVMNSPTTGGISVTVSGNNFGATNSSPTLTTNRAVCATTQWISASSAGCFVGQGNYGTGSMKATVKALTGQLATGVTFDAPVVASGATNGPLTGSMVSVTGSNFGSVNTSPTVVLGNSNCATSAWVSNTAVACWSAPGTGLMKASSAGVATMFGTLTVLFSFNAPTVTGQTPNAPLSAMASVTITGSNFGTVDTSLTAHTGSIICSTTQWVASSSMTCLMKTGVQSGVDVGYGLTGFTSFGTLTASFTFNAPAVSYVAQANAPTTAGSSVTLSGTNFGLSNISPTASFGGAACGTSVWLSGTAVTCGLTAAGYGQGKDLLFIVSSLVSSTTKVFTFDAPRVDAVAANAPASGTASVTLTGLNFGTVNTSPVIATGNTNCASTAWISNTAAVCATSAGTSASLRATLNTAASVGTMSRAFTFDAPVVSANTATNGPTSGMSSVTLSGANFAVVNSSPTALVGALCTTTAWVSSSAVTCSLAAGFSAGATSKAVVAGLWGTTTTVFSFSAPVVTAAALVNAPITGQASVTLSGTNFATTNSSPTVWVGATTCATTAWVSASSVTCTSPVLSSASGLQQPVRAALLAAIGTSTRLFSFDAPAAVASSLTNAATTGGASVTVTGSNFGIAGQTPTVAVGGVPCTTSAWFSSTAVACLAGPAIGAGRRITVETSKLVGSATAMITFDSPVILASLTPNVPGTKTSSVTLTGSNFGAAASSATARVGSTQCLTTAWVSSSAVVCATPTGASTSLRGTLEVAGVVGTATKLFTFNSPLVTLNQPNADMLYNSPISGGASLTIRGSEFGATDLSLTATIDATACTTSMWVSSSSVTCLARAPTALNLMNPSLTVQSQGQAGTATRGFTFNSPVVSYVTVFNGPTSGLAAVTVTGADFGSVDRSNTVYIGDVRCSTSYWVTGTSAVCGAPPSSSNNLRVTMRVSDLIGTQTTVFSFDSPAITGLSTINSAVGGLSITFSGSNFGFTNRSPTSIVGKTVCATSSWLSASAVVCQLQAGGSESHRSAIIVDNLVGTSTGSFSFDSPLVTQVAAVNAPTTTGAFVSVSGINFGLTSLSPSVRVGNTLCGTTQWISSSSVNCLTSSGFDMVKRVNVHARGILGTSTGLFSYDAPAVTHANLKNAPTTGGSSVTLSGTNFGAVNSSPSAYKGATLCQTSVWTSSSAVACLTPAGTSVTSASKVRVGASTGTLTAVFTFHPPTVTALTTNAPTSGGALVTVRGMNFGLTNRSPTVHMASSICATSLWVSDSSVSCRLVPGMSSGLHATVKVDGTFGTSTQAFTFDTPLLTYAANANSPASMAASVTLSGTNFAVVNSTPTAYLGSTTCTTSTWVSASSVKCASPVGNSLMLRQNLAIGTLVGTATAAFSFAAPVVTSGRFNGPATGGSSITLAGSNLGVTNMSPTFAVDNKVCSTTQWFSNTAARCQVPANGGKALHINARVAGLIGTQTSSFTYDAPATTVVGETNAPTTGMASLTLSGHNFGSTNLSPTVHTGSTICATSTWISASSVTCNAAAGTSHNLRNTVTMNTVVGTATNTFSYSAPVLTYTVPYNGAASTGTSITLSGTSFGGLNVTPTAFIGSTMCATSTWISSSSVTCRTPAGSSLALRSRVAVGSLAGTSTLAFTFDAPVIDQLLTGTSITVTGDNFGVIDYSPTAKLGANVCETTSWVSTSLLTCKSSVTSTQNLVVAVTTSALVGSKTLDFTFAGLRVVLAANLNAFTIGDVNRVRFFIANILGINPNQLAAADATGSSSSVTLSFQYWPSSFTKEKMQEFSQKIVNMYNAGTLDLGWKLTAVQDQIPSERILSQTETLVTLQLKATYSGFLATQTAALKTAIAAAMTPTNAISSSDIRILYIGQGPMGVVVNMVFLGSTTVPAQTSWARTLQFEDQWLNYNSLPYLIESVTLSPFPTAGVPLPAMTSTLVKIYVEGAYTAFKDAQRVAFMNALSVFANVPEANIPLVQITGNTTFTILDVMVTDGWCDATTKATTAAALVSSGLAAAIRPLVFRGVMMYQVPACGLTAPAPAATNSVAPTTTTTRYALTLNTAYTGFTVWNLCSVRQYLASVAGVFPDQLGVTVVDNAPTAATITLYIDFWANPLLPTKTAASVWTALNAQHTGAGLTTGFTVGSFTSTVGPYQPATFSMCPCQGCNNANVAPVVYL